MRPSLPSSSTWLRTAITAVLLLWLFVCLAELFSWWQWGHFGFNGASFAQAARNSSRFGMLGPFLWYSDFAPPDPTSAYAHHPLLLHLHGLLAQAITGSQAEWVYRLTPALYAWGTLVLLYDLARRAGGRRFGLLTALLYVSLPGMAIFANTVIHEQGTLFWMVAAVWCELRYVADRRLRFRLGTLASFALALNFGWAAYFGALLVFLHALVRAFAHRRHRVGRNRALLLAGGLALVVALCFGLFLAWASWAKGGLAELRQTFSWRSGGPQLDRFRVSTFPIEQFYGWTPTILYALFLPTLLWRRVRRNPASMIALLFVAVQLIHSTVFRQAAGVHAYWEYYAAPGVALGGALALRTLWALPRRLSPRLGTGIGTALIAAAAGVLLLIHAPFAVRQRNFGMASAGLSGNGWEIDHSDELRWLREISRRYPHGTARFLFLQSFGDRPEIRNLLDAPIATVQTLRQRPSDRGIPNVLLADLSAVRSPVLRNQLLARARRGGGLWDERFVALDLSRPDDPPHAWRSERTEAGWLFRWFVHPRAPQLRWLPLEPVVPPGPSTTLGDPR